MYLCRRILSGYFGRQNYDNNLKYLIMKKINYQHYIFAATIILFAGLTLTSCDNVRTKRASQKFSREVIHSFPNTNWAFEEEVLEFPFDIEDTSWYYDISLSLLYDSSVVTLTDIPLSLTLSTPDGMQAMSKSHFMLDTRTNADLKLAEDGNNLEANVVVFPRRKLKVPGAYKLTVYRRAEKADNLGFISLAAKVNVVK